MSDFEFLEMKRTSLKFTAKVLTAFGIAMIKAFFLCFYNGFVTESSSLALS